MYSGKSCKGQSAQVSPTQGQGHLPWVPLVLRIYSLLTGRKAEQLSWSGYDAPSVPENIWQVAVGTRTQWEGTPGPGGVWWHLPTFPFTLFPRLLVIHWNFTSLLPLRSSRSEPPQGLCTYLSVSESCSANLLTAPPSQHKWELTFTSRRVLLPHGWARITLCSSFPDPLWAQDDFLYALLWSLSS